MKKIIRIASVIALASASLLYVGCTKDFSADIAKTNQDVAALNQKIETLNSTVQTINGTVENLKTTKADLSAVNALGDKVTTAEGKITTLGGKIDDLDGKLTSTKNDLTAAIATAKQEAIDAASADAASKLAAAKTELEGVINGVKAKVDSLEAFTVAQTDSLRKDVDSLYANYEALEARIAALEGKVAALAARVTSIVAVPSINPDFTKFHIKDTVDATKPYKDTTLFGATFAVTPKAAVKDIKPGNLKLNFKSGLTRGAAATDSTVTNIKVAAINEEKGEITVFAGYAPISEKKSIDYSLYYSLEFTAKDAASEKEYGVNSEYVKVQKAEEQVDLVKNFVPVKVDGFTELEDSDKILNDTLAFNGADGKEFGKLFTKVAPAFKVNGGLLSVDELSKLVGVVLKVKIDTNKVSFDTTGVTWFKVTNNGTSLNKADASHVGKTLTIKTNGFEINKETLEVELIENHTIGAKTVEFTLPAVTEPWTYTSYNKVSRTISITDCADVNAVVPTDGIKKGAFKIKKDSGNGVDIVVTNAERNAAAKDTVYNVVFEQKADITKDTPDTVNFTINWKYTLEARPADATIALADVDTVATDYTKSIKVAIDSKIVDKTFAAFDAAYDKTIDSAAVTAAIEGATVVLDSVVFDGEAVDGFTTDGKVIDVPALSKAGAYSVILNKTVFGIKYTYTYTINLAWKEALKLHATPYISAGVATVDADTTVSPYTLDAMDLAKYLQVFNADTLAKGFGGYTVKFKAELEDSAKFAHITAEDTTYAIGHVDCPEPADVNNGVLSKSILKWNGYNGREVKVTAYLANSKDTVDTYTFTLKYNKPITSFAAGTQEVKRVAGVNAEAVLTKSFDVKGLYHGDKNLIVDTTGAWINRTNYYGCEILFNVKEAVFKVDGVETLFTKDVDYKVEGLDEIADGLYKATNGVLRNAKVIFLGDNNNKNIELSVPVILGYKYDYNWNEAYKDNVVIKVVNE